MVVLERLDVISRRFEAAWQAGSTPRIDDYLDEAQVGEATDGVHPILLELIPIDLEYRWRSPRSRMEDTCPNPPEQTGAFQREPDLPLRPLLEDYLARYPAIGSAYDLPLELIVEEYQVRHLWGDRPEHAEYGRRFPRQSESLERSVLRDADQQISLSRAENLAARLAGVENLAASITGREFLSELTRTGLVSSEDIRVLKARIIEPNCPLDASILAESLVREDKLTPFQAEAIFYRRMGSLILGNYVLLERLGQGGMGEVYKAKHRVMGRAVAIKMLKPALALDEHAAARFKREIKALARLKHPNIVTAYDAGQCGGDFFLVMEYVEGRDLASVLKERGPLPIGQATGYVIQAAQGLQYAHQEGVLHRDMKPANLLIDRSGAVKILDLGLSRAAQPITEASGESITQSDQIIGTYDYMAPEQAANARLADVRCDVYSLGCTLYALVTGTIVYPRESIPEKILAHRAAPVPSLRVSRPDAPARLDSLLQRMIAKSPEDRPQTMAEVIDNLRGYAPSGASRPAPAKRTARKSVRLWVLATAIAPLLVLLGAVLYVSTNHGTVRIEIRDPAANIEVKVDGDRIEVAGLAEPLRLRAGTHFLEVDSPDFKSYSRSFAVRRAGEETLTVSLEPKPPTGESRRLAAVSSQPGSAQRQQETPANVPPTTEDRERSAAEWVLQCGGWVRVAAGSREVRVDSPERLPSGAFTLRGAFLSGSQQVRDVDMRHLKNLQGLRALSLDRSRVSDAAMTPLAELSQLENLNLSRTRISDAGLQSLRGLIQLQSLALQDCQLVTDAGLEHLASLKQLKSLDLWGTQVGDSGLKTISELRQLENLKVTGGGITDGGARHLAALKQLRSLDVGGTNLSDAGLDLLNELSGLTHLLVNSTVVSDAGLMQIAKLRNLTFLDLTLTRISDQGLASLATLPRLAELKLSGDYITDEGISQLTKCKRVSVLNLEGTCITSSGIRRLQAELPSCRISHWLGPQAGAGDKPEPATSIPTSQAALTPVFSEEFLEERALFKRARELRAWSGGLFIWESSFPGNGFTVPARFGEFSNGIIEVRGRIREGFGGSWSIVLGTHSSSREIRIFVFHNGAMVIVGDTLPADPSWEYGKGQFMHPAVKPVGQWNNLRVVLEPTGITVWMNGQRVCKRASVAKKSPTPYDVSLCMQNSFGKARAEFDHILFWPTTDVTQLPRD
ncbi:MAG: protein kinase domain-containing protein [Pirellulales bacterium]